MGVLDPGVPYIGVPEGPCIGVRLYVDTLPPVLPAFITAILIHIVKVLHCETIQVALQEKLQDLTKFATLLCV